MFPSSLFIILLCLIKISEGFNFKDHFSTKRLYPIVTNKATPIKVPETCELVQLHLVSRHGARYPSPGDNERFDTLDKLFANISLAKEWRNPFNKFEAGLLTSRGERELYLLGQRARKRYFKFWKNITYNTNVVQLQSSTISRSGQSGIAYSLGLFEGYGTLGKMKLQPVYIFSVPKKKDVELLMHHACPIWVNISKNNPETKRQLETFLRTHLSLNVKRINDLLGINPPLKAIHLDYIYRACTFEVTVFDRSDTWCSLLKKDDFLKLEFYHDLLYYHYYSYGTLFNTKLACQYYTNMIKSVENFLDGKSQLKSILKFGHAETILFLITMIGLFQDTQPLKSDKYFLQVNSQKFRTSKIAPFGSNIYFEIYNCTNRYDLEPNYSTTLIQVLVNEKPYVIPGCYKYCPWNKFKAILGDAINCDFKNMCKSNNFNNTNNIEKILLQ
ncbi:hypothetical protein Glove_502g7 [Diversispora epigaea]|uniref:Multiple inositol polyphosphate phosphatase 1 n=1 Tax=Diversispora epigaea TaxID=1348612 RepID=A0A397GQH3_9GLOM|nr:hypothetical protein Glove_502g7 [Diversispora epigaea]